MTFLVILLLLGMAFLGAVVLFKNKQIEKYKLVYRNLKSMKIIQYMFEIMGANISGDEKIEEINKVAIESYGCKNSSIVTFDGYNFHLKASNVDEAYRDAIKEICKDKEFKNNMLKNTSKYLTISADKVLSYNSAIERSIRSCIFSPIYYNDTLLGFWIIEDEETNAFDDISKSELSKLKNNLGVFLESVMYEALMESIENVDKQTGFYNNIYLYSKGRKELVKNDNNCLCLIEMSNLLDVNVKYSRQVGNVLFNKTIEAIKEGLDDDIIKIRYSGPRILILFTNATDKFVHKLVEKLLSKLKTEVVTEKEGSNIEMNFKIIMHNIKKQSNVEKEVESMIKYLDRMEEDNTIKII